MTILLALIMGTLNLSKAAAKQPAAPPAAAKEIQLLKPSEIKQFPAAVKKALEAEKCMIPSVSGAKQPSGWAKGKFADKIQTDWAVLCSDKNGKSKIKVVWGGRDFACPDSFAMSPNKSRAIHSVSHQQVIAYLKKDRKEAPKTFQQEGIADVFVEKASVVYFCSGGKWMRTTGSL